MHVTLVNLTVLNLGVINNYSLKSAIFGTRCPRSQDLEQPEKHNQVSRQTSCFERYTYPRASCVLVLFNEAVRRI